MLSPSRTLGRSAGPASASVVALMSSLLWLPFKLAAWLAGCPSRRIPVLATDSVSACNGGHGTTTTPDGLRRDELRRTDPYALSLRPVWHGRGIALGDRGTLGKEAPRAARLAVSQGGQAAADRRECGRRTGASPNVRGVQGRDLDGRSLRALRRAAGQDLRQYRH